MLLRGYMCRQKCQYYQHAVLVFNFKYLLMQTPDKNLRPYRPPYYSVKAMFIFGAAFVLLIAGSLFRKKIVGNKMGYNLPDVAVTAGTA